MIQSEWDEGKRIAQLFLYWFTQSQSYIQFTKTTWAWFPLYSKVLQIKHQDYTFEHNAHRNFDSHKNLEPQPTRITLADLKSHQANHPDAQERPNLMVAVPSTPYMCSSRYSQAKMPPRSTKIFKHKLQLCIVERERFPEINDTISFRKTHIRTSARENTTYIVWFKWKQSIEFSVQSADSTWLKWNQSIEK